MRPVSYEAREIRCRAPCTAGVGPEAAQLSAWERAFGIYDPGRFGWVLSDVYPPREPIPAKGMLGLWEWKPPADLDIWLA